MLLDSHDLTRLGRLLDEVMDLPSGEVEPWFARLAEDDLPLAPRLREMLAMNDTEALAGFLTSGPHADVALDDGIALSGELVGPYRLIRPLGGGGMGEVWLAERADGALKREVALKLPRLAWGSGLAERMARERDIGALLEHPHIARLYDAGVDGRGRPYLAFERIEGEVIDAWCDARSADVRSRLRLYLQVLEAVAYAHGRLVIHRDLKPSNILVTTDGQARLLDFGIAKLLEETVSEADGQLTRQVGRMLTPAYASPEQIRDEPLSVASDVYSLGVLLYELLSGSLPFGRTARSAAETLEAALHEEPTRPSRLRFDALVAGRRRCDRPARLSSQLAGDLDTIVLKAIRKVPGERYSSVERFAEDVQRYLAYTPITARPPSIAHRLRLFARRHRPALSMAGAGSAFAMVLAVLLWQQHARTVEQSVRADAVRDFMLDMVEDVEPDEAHAGEEITGRQMLHRGLQRAHERFRAEPRLQGEVLSELYRMLNRIGDDGAKLKILDESYALLRRSAPDEDAALNKVRVQLAEVALDDNRFDDAASLATTALEACATRDAECAKARAYANGVLGTIVGRRGDVDGSLQYQRAVVSETERGFGADHAEAAIAWYALAVKARNAGEFDEAGLALGRAIAINAHATLPAREHADIQRLQAVLLQDQGRFGEARQVLVDLLKQDVDGAERSRMLRLLAGAELALGHAQATLAAADRALALVGPNDRGVGPLFIHQSKAMALSLVGRTDEAVAEMKVLTEALASRRFGASTTEALRARRLQAEIVARDGKLAEAAQALETLLEDYSRIEKPPGVELPLTLDLLGCVRRGLGRGPEAIVLHERAHAGLLTRLGPAHPFVERSALYRLRARLDQQPTDANRTAFDDAARRFASRFDADSAWPRIIEAQRMPSSAAASKSDVVPMIL